MFDLLQAGCSVRQLRSVRVKAQQLREAGEGALTSVARSGTSRMVGVKMGAARMHEGGGSRRVGECDVANREGNSFIQRFPRSGHLTKSLRL
jgi:hypothetical protein